MPERIAISLNGRPVATEAGTSVAAAVTQAEADRVRTSLTGEPRGPLCGMGVCFECRLTVDGVPHQRACQTLCRPGMKIETTGPSLGASAVHTEALCRHSSSEKHFDLLVVGAGPAGIAAACSAAEAGKRVGLVDDNPIAGGQIWRAERASEPPKQAATWFSRLSQLPIEILAGTQIFGAEQPTTLLADSAAGAVAIHASRIILACGARERFLPFPGWTLPGVFGAGGLQALVKSGYPIARKKVIVAGSGPLLLAVTAYLAGRGADVRRIAEQTPLSKLARFGVSLLCRQPGKITEAIGLVWRVRGTPYSAGCWPIRAGGERHLESVTLTDGRRTWTEPCDTLACGFGLVPNLELPTLLGCAVDSGHVRVDADQQTSIPGIYAVGELTGIGGLDKALVEGRIAGWSAAGRVHGLQLEGQRTQRFVALLNETFALRDELRTIVEDATIVCRCEDVTFGRLKKCENWRDAKLQTRAGMGPCQGRICGPALSFLLGWAPESVRPPILPTALGNLLWGSEGETERCGSLSS